METQCRKNQGRWRAQTIHYERVSTMRSQSQGMIWSSNKIIISLISSLKNTLNLSHKS